MKKHRTRHRLAILLASGLALGVGGASAHGLSVAHPFKELDTNRDGAISKAEYNAHSAKHAKASKKAAALAETHPFNELDQDKNGSISKKEYDTHSAKHAGQPGHGHGAKK